MPFQLDLTADELPTPAVATNNMEVLDLDPLSRGAVFPREISVKGTGADGALMYATWSGFPAGLQVGDFVICWNDGNDTILRVAGAGGSTSAIPALDDVSVSKLWESDGGAVAWSTDASGNLSGESGLIFQTTQPRRH